MNFAPPALALRNVSKTFLGHRVLDRLNLEVQEGEVHALAGQNGSGKSTAIKILCGYHKPDSGATGSVRGEPIELGSATAARAAGLRFVHQDLGLVQSMSVMENLMLAERQYPTSMGRVRWGQARQLATEAIARAGLDIDVRRPVAELSLANQTLVAISRALLGTTERSTIVLDEPTAALPVREVNTLFTAIRNLSQAGTSVMIVTHHIDEVLDIADRITVLRSGQSLGTHNIADTDHDSIVRLIVGSDVARGGQSNGAREFGDVVFEADKVSGELVTDFCTTVRAGEVVGVAGLTGSGRETLGRLLTGGAPRSGSVRSAGKTVAASKPRRALEAGVASAFGERQYSTIPTLSVRHNMTLCDVGSQARMGRIRHRAERSEVDSWITKLGIVAGGPESKLASLSGGNQQKVLIARALRLKPTMLVLDDPTAGVDVGAREQVHGIVDEAVHVDGLGVLIISTDSEELSRLCDRVLIMIRGQVAAELSGDRLTSEQIDSALLMAGSQLRTTHEEVGP